MGNPTSIFIHSAIWAGPDLSRTWLSWCGKPSLLGAQWICGSRSNGHSDGLDMTIGGESYYSWMGNILVGFGSGSDLSFWIITTLNILNPCFECPCWSLKIMSESSFKQGFEEKTIIARGCFPVSPRHPSWAATEGTMCCGKRLVATVRELSNQVAATEFWGLVASVLELTAQNGLHGSF